MNKSEFKELLRKNEGLKLDFKRTYQIDKQPPDGTTREDWSELSKRQWDELIKDIISLANGNVGVSSVDGILVIGVDNDLLADGMRELHDVSNLQLTTSQILDKVNSACQPPIHDIICESFEIDSKVLYTISIPPTPYVHEITRPLITGNGDIKDNGKIDLSKKKEFTKFTAFIRKGESVRPASGAERRAIEEDKGFERIRLDENLRTELSNNLKKLLEKRINIGVVNPSRFFGVYRKLYELEVNQDLMIQQCHFANIFDTVFSVSRSRNALSSRYIAQAIDSGRYMRYSQSEGRYETTPLFRHLTELLRAMDQFRNDADQPLIMSMLNRWKNTNPTNDFVTVPFYEAVFAFALLDQHENIVNLSAAILEFLDGDAHRLDTLQLNPSSPIHGEINKLEAEKLSDTDIANWLLQTSNN